jgi:toxin YoeB
VNLSFTPQSWDDYQFWLQTDKKILRRINELVKDTLRSPHDGIGKPEPLRQGLAGYWSRRITEEHRMVYRQIDSGILLIQLRYHYKK